MNHKWENISWACYWDIKLYFESKILTSIKNSFFPPCALCALQSFLYCFKSRYSCFLDNICSKASFLHPLPADQFAIFKSPGCIISKFTFQPENRVQDYRYSLKAQIMPKTVVKARFLQAICIHTIILPRFQAPNVFNSVQCLAKT